MNYDKYDEIINGEFTYNQIADILKQGESCFVGWTDQAGTHLDILFTLKPQDFGNNVQGGLTPSRDLFISIMRMGAFGFEIGDTDTHSSYYGEKLRITGTTADELAHLINGVKKILYYEKS
ncbi:MAG: hypothetical protein ACREGC_00990 [Minisyncoccia bacterium]